MMKMSNAFALPLSYCRLDQFAGDLTDSRGLIIGIDTSEEIEPAIHAINNHDPLVSALEGMLEMYTSMINSGDCGNWDPETNKEVIAARIALFCAHPKRKGEDDE